ncbi:type I-G CRISPR-associated RAMP protein Csb1/Cas7g [Desulfotalea psychrophila]|uniref:Uncharacterized protein n=1 Tax=Desulfotalea psychrophila (strain LSv54 / DSM 12343) TaxID=177439 RepID=Q6ARV7_DESPS|nr:type I-U CRISPR-associated RAMP protein Csb1/Cas7u [Desulfotalea psychrophila]CAG34918.1 unknown protein [Desulfotalea psychrophila LSv54]
MSDVAISIKANLKNVNGSDHIYPPTFAGVGHNFVALDKGTGKAKAVQVDSVGSFANRIEAELAALGILPEITTSVANQTLSVNELPHRIYDAILRDSFLGEDSWRNSDIGHQLLSSTTKNATALLLMLHDTSLGGWDSHAGKSVKGVKISRSVSCEIWGYDVFVAQHTSPKN